MYYNPLFAILPLLIGGFVALLCGISERTERAAKYIALAGALGSSAFSILLLLHAQQATQAYQAVWFSFAQSSFQLTMALAPMNQILLLLVAIISPLIFLYSIGYMDRPNEQSRFYFELSLFAVSMILLSMSGGFLTMFIAWEGLGVTSYLLIGFWYQKKNPPAAARTAITTILLGDIFMLAGMLILWNQFGTFSFSAIEAAASGQAGTTLMIGLAFVLIGAFTKSAQFPFHEWLSEAMEGPTPVSAFLHSSTMVKAGVFIVILLFPLFAAFGQLLHVMLIIGLVTTVIGALNALSSQHIKKVLAYSTVEDLGLMFVALGLNAVLAAVIFFIVQAAYKALMLMSAGTMIKANDEDTNIYNLTAFGRNKVLMMAAFVGALSVAGIFPLSGFFGKLAIDSTATSNALVYIILTAVDFVTAMYIFRWMFVPMHNQKRKMSIQVTGRYATMKRSMVVPQVILAALIVLFSINVLFFGNYSYIPGLAPQVSAFGKLIFAPLSALVESAVGLAGISIAYLFFFRRSSLFAERSKARLFLSNGFFVSTAYLYLTKAVLAFARGIEIFDTQLNRMLYTGARGVVNIGSAVKISQRGNVTVYIAALAAGLAFVIAFLVFLK